MAKSSNEGTTLWHQKLGHLNMVSFKKLKIMVNGMNLKEVPLHHVCEACIEGKHQKTSFPKDEMCRNPSFGLVTKARVYKVTSQEKDLEM